MSSENISVSLSRLALAKAIKTPDAGEEECEPWAKSIIFHQSHISPGMLENVMNPQQQRRPQHPRSRQQQQRGYPPQQDPRRQSRQLLDQSGPRRYPQQTSRPSSSYGMLNSSVNHLGPDDQHSRRTPPIVNPPRQQPQQKRQTRYVPSDDEEEEEEEEEDGSDDDASSQSSIPAINITLPGPSLSPTEKKPATVIKEQPSIPVASDDESSIDQDNDDLDNSRRDQAIFNEWTVPLVEEGEQDEHMKARRMSTLRQLERGPSLHKRSRSDGAMEKIYTTDVAIDNDLTTPLQEGDGIEQWRQTVLDAVDSIGTTPAAAPLAASSETTTSSVNESTTTGEEPKSPRGRRTTLGEMDMMYYMQQQQLQMLQQQQLAQMQYQQAAWQAAQQQMMQQQMMMQQQQPSRRTKVKSVSAMDMMMQIEQEKEIKAAALRKPKRIDPSKAQIDGLLGKVKDQGKHNISFQQQQTIKDRADRMAGRSTPRQRQSMMNPMMLPNPSDPYLLQQQQQAWQRPQHMSRSESSPGLQQPYMYGQTLNSTSSLAPPMMSASKSTGRPTSMMRPQSAWGNF